MNKYDELVKLAKDSSYKKISNVLMHSKRQTRNDIYQFFHQVMERKKEFEKYRVTFKELKRFFADMEKLGMGSLRGKTFFWNYYPQDVAKNILGMPAVLETVSNPNRAEAPKNAHTFFIRPDFPIHVPLDMRKSEQVKIIDLIKLLPTVD